MFEVQLLRSDGGKDHSDQHLWFYPIGVKSEMVNSRLGIVIDLFALFYSLSVIKVGRYGKIYLSPCGFIASIRWRLGFVPGCHFSHIFELVEVRGWQEWDLPPFQGLGSLDFCCCCSGSVSWANGSIFLAAVHKFLNFLLLKFSFCWPARVNHDFSLQCPHLFAQL